MQALTFFFAFVAVLALIGVAAWLVRRFAGNRLGANTNRGRMPRLAVIDAAAVDGRRRLVLVRRDNVEHLLMIGGPTDIVVEPNIVRAMPGRDQMPQRPARRRAPNRRRASRRCPTRAGATARRSAGRRLRSCRAANAGAAAAAGAPLLRRRSAPPGAGARNGAASRACDRAIRWPASRRSRSAGRPEPALRAARRTDALARDLAHRTGDAAPAAPERSAEGAARCARRSVAAPPRRRRRRPRRCRPPTRISPRWRSGWKPRFAGRPATDRSAPPVAPEPPPAPRAAQRATDGPAGCRRLAEERL